MNQEDLDDLDELIRMTAHLALPEHEHIAIIALLGYSESSKRPTEQERLKQEGAITVDEDGARCTLTTNRCRFVFRAPMGAFRKCEAAFEIRCQLYEIKIESITSIGDA